MSNDATPGSTDMVPVPLSRMGFAAIGVRLTAVNQFEPEQTMAALVVHHLDAKYYALARSGGDERNVSWVTPTTRVLFVWDSEIARVGVIQQGLDRVRRDAPKHPKRVW